MRVNAIRFKCEFCGARPHRPCRFTRGSARGWEYNPNNYMHRARLDRERARKEKKEPSIPQVLGTITRMEREIALLRAKQRGDSSACIFHVDCPVCKRPAGEPCKGQRKSHIVGTHALRRQLYVAKKTAKKLGLAC